MIAKEVWGPSTEMGVIWRYGGTTIISVRLLKSLRFGRDSRFSLIKILVALCANFGTGSSDRSLSSVAVCSLRKLPRKQLSRSSGRVLCGTSLASSCGSWLRLAKSGDLDLQC